jgi:putative two-component system response regulator
MEREILRNSRILIIDDQPANVHLLERILRLGGYLQFKGLMDSTEAVEMFKEFKPDLVLLDLRMPRISGFDLLSQFKLFVPDGTYLPILILSADLSQPSKQKALSLGAKDFVTKPFDNTEVLLRIENLLETRWLHTQLLEHNHILDRKVRERTQQLVDAQFEIAKRLALAAEYRDDSTGQHTYRVGRLAGLIAGGIGLPDGQVELIQEAAPLHDVGKIGIPDSLLLKPGKLTPNEYEVVKTHTAIGARILSGSKHPLLQLAEQIAQHHHERWDGSGYNGIQGEDIPLEARIVAIADVFDVLTHERCYKPAQSYDEGVKEIRRCRGRDFDPRLVDAFLRLTQNNDLKNLSASIRDDVALTSQGNPSFQI